MNRLMEERGSWVEPTHALRDHVMGLLDDADLAFNAGGSNATFGALIREFGEIEHAYVESFKTLKQDFSYRHPDVGIAASVDGLQTWFKQLDSEMKTTLEAFSNDDLDSKPIARAGGWDAPISLQLDIYLQAALIFLGKAAIYARALNKPLSSDFKDWIG